VSFAAAVATVRPGPRGTRVFFLKKEFSRLNTAAAAKSFVLRYDSVAH
jgi:hypothetical protein